MFQEYQVLRKQCFNYFDDLSQKYNVINLAFSCGLDSSILAIIIYDYYLHNVQKLNFNKKLAFNFLYFNHKIRQQAEEEEKYVAKLCTKYNINFYTANLYELYNNLNFNKNDYFFVQKYSAFFNSELKGRNNNKLYNLSENEARFSRYAFFEYIHQLQTKDKSNSVLFLTAHHSNDLSENMLFRLCRGTGIKGLSFNSGITNIGYLKIFKPLQETTKDNLKKIFQKLKLYKFTSSNLNAFINDIKIFEDDTNYNKKYSRNLIRDKFENLAKELNSKYTKHFLHFSTNLFYTELILQKYIDMELSKIKITEERFYSKFFNFQIFAIDKIQFLNLLNTDLTFELNQEKINFQKNYFYLLFKNCFEKINIDISDMDEAYFDDLYKQLINDKNIIIKNQKKQLLIYSDQRHLIFLNIKSGVFKKNYDFLAGYWQNVFVAYQKKYLNKNNLFLKNSLLSFKYNNISKVNFLYRNKDKSKILAVKIINRIILNSFLVKDDKVVYNYHKCKNNIIDNKQKKIRLRTWNTNDFVFKKDGHKRSLKKYFNDIKVPAVLRNQLLLIATDDGEVYGFATKFRT